MAGDFNLSGFGGAERVDTEEQGWNERRAWWRKKLLFKRFFSKIAIWFPEYFFYFYRV
jgi:hypothetical protein